MNRLDKIDALWRLQTLLPNHASEHIRIFHQLENESSAWSTYSPLEFKTKVALRLEAICRNFRDESVSGMDARRREAMTDSTFWWDELSAPPRAVTRADVLKWTASLVLDFNLELEPRDNGLYINLTRFHSEGKFIVGVIEHSWLPDFKRLHKGLFLKDDRELYVRTTKEINRFGKTIPREVPVISIAASAKYGMPAYDEILLTAHTINTNSLDLTFANIKVPSLDERRSAAGRTVYGMKTTGGRDVFTPDMLWYVRKNHPKGAAPDHGIKSGPDETEESA